MLISCFQRVSNFFHLTKIFIPQSTLNSHKNKITWNPHCQQCEISQAATCFKAASAMLIMIMIATNIYGSCILHKGKVFPRWTLIVEHFSRTQKVHLNFRPREHYKRQKTYLSVAFMGSFNILFNVNFFMLFQCMKCALNRCTEKPLKECLALTKLFRKLKIKWEKAKHLHNFALKWFSFSSFLGFYFMATYLTLYLH